MRSNTFDKCLCGLQKFIWMPTCSHCRKGENDHVERELRSKVNWIIAEVESGEKEDDEEYAIQCLVDYVLGLLK